MAEINVSDVQAVVPTREQVSVIAKDPELRKLKPASPEYQAALAKKFPKDGTKPAASAPAVKEEPVETNKEVSGQTEASKDDAGDEGIDGASTKAQRRIAELIKERNLERAERESLKTRIAELEKAGKTPTQAAKQATAEVQSDTTKFDKPKPKLSDFKDFSEYTEALTDWKADEREWKSEQKSKTKAAQESAAGIATKFWDEGSKLEKELGLDEGDFKALIEGDGVKKYPPTVRAIFESPFGAQIAYELSNLDDAEKERFGKMTDLRQVAYIGRLEAKFESKKQTTETQAISAAKAPGKPLKKGTGGATTPGITSGMSFKAYEAARKAQQPDKFRR